ncbi:MAG: hypothetical protein ACOYS2_02975, partial [Patescibacteria group bacterium]
EVEYPGFRSWKKKTQVKSGLSSEFWNVLLVRENYEKEAYSRENIDYFFTSPKNNFLATALNGANGLEIKIVDIESKNVEKEFIIPGFDLLPIEKRENIEWSPSQNSRISVPVVKKGLPEEERDYFILNLDDNTSFSLKEFLGVSSIRDVRWDPEKEDYLFFLSQNNLYRANISLKEDLLLITDEAASFDLSKTDVYFSQNSNHITYKKPLSGNGEKSQVTYDFPKDLEGNIVKMIVYDNERIAFWDESDNLFIYNQGEEGAYFKKLGSSIEGLHFSDDGKKLLFWTKNEISAYFLRDWNVQPIRQENDFTNVARYIEEIKNVQWFSDYEHVIFSVGPYVKVIELDSRDRRNSSDIITTKTSSPFVIANAYLEKLFFIDSVSENKNDLFSIEFPEKTSFLGL